MFSVAWSPDGTKLAAGVGWGSYPDYHGKVIVFSSSGNVLWESKDLGDFVYSVAWSPDGTKLAAGTSSNKVFVFSSSGSVLWESGDLGGSVFSVAWSPQGDKLAAGTGYPIRKVFVFSSSGSKLWESGDLGGSVFSVAWSPQGDKLAAGTLYANNPKVFVFSSSGSKLWEKDLGGPVYSVAWSPDGTKLAAGTGSGKVFVFSSSGSVLWESPDLGGWVLSVAWSPDGTKLAAGIGWDETVGFNRYDHGKVFVFSSSGSVLWESPDLGGSVESVAWSPDGTKLAAGTGSGKVFVLSCFNVFGFCPLFPFVFVVSVGVVWGIGGFGFSVSFVLFIVLRRRYGGLVFGRHVSVGSGSVRSSGSGVGAGSGGGSGAGKGASPVVSDFGSLLSEVAGVLRSSRDVSRVSSLLDRVRGFCSGLGAGSDVCGELGRVEGLLEAVSRVNELFAVGREPSRPLVERLRALEEAVGLCSKHGIGCSDVEGVLRRVREEFSRVSGDVRGLVESARSLLSGGRALDALGKVSEAVRLCGEAGIKDVVKECGEAEEIRARIEGVRELLESGVSVKVPHDVTPVEGSPLTLEVAVHAPASLRGPVEEVFIDFSAAAEAGLSVREGRVELPLIRPGGAVTAKVEAVPTKAGVLKVPWTVCADGLLCVTRSLTLEVVPKPPEVGVSEARAEVAEVSLADVYGFLREPVAGLVGGYGCVEGYSPRDVVLKAGIAPDGLEGRWECCLLGCGGWGCAYLCRSEGREVVFKVPRGFESIFEGGFVPTVSVRLLKRVRDEAGVIRALKHPNVLKVLGVGRLAPVLAYEFGDGGSVEWQLSRGWEPGVREAVLLGIQVGDALRYIHSRGLVHGDVKPGNVFFVGGVAKVGDFSTLTKLITRTSTHSRFGYTPGFRAPEQAYADVRRRAIELGIESRTDVYLLGNLLLYALTGDSLDGEEAIRPGAVEEATEPIQNQALRNLLRKTLNPDPAKRPSTEDVVKELLKILKSLGDTT